MIGIPYKLPIALPRCTLLGGADSRRLPSRVCRHANPALRFAYPIADSQGLFGGTAVAVSQTVEDRLLQGITVVRIIKAVLAVSLRLPVGLIKVCCERSLP